MFFILKNEIKPINEINEINTEITCGAVESTIMSTDKTEFELPPSKAKTQSESWLSESRSNYLNLVQFDTIYSKSMFLKTSSQNKKNLLII